MVYNNLHTRIFFLISIAFLTGCGGSSSDDSSAGDGGFGAGQDNLVDQDNNGGQDANDPPSSQQSRSSLAQIKQEGKVVLRYESTDETYTFFLSDGAVEEIPSDLVASVTENPEGWRLNLSFEDGEASELYYLGDDLDLNSANINLNPSGNAPLSAMANFSTPIPGQVRVLIPGKGENGVAIEKTFVRSGTDYQIPVLGLYQDYANPVMFQFLDGVGNPLVSEVVTIQTQAVASTPNFVILENRLTADDNQVYMEVGLKHAFDQRGELRWAYTGDDLNQLYDRLPNGNWVSSASRDSVVYHFPEFAEVDMLGNIIRTYNVPNLGHHEIRVIDDGATYLVGSNSVFMSPTGFTDDLGTLQEDTVVEISAETGLVTREYDFNQLLDNTRTPIVNDILDDWYHINSADVDLGPDGVSGTEDDAIIVSGRHQAAVTKVNRNSGELEWILAPHELWPERLQDRLLTPIDENGDALDISNINFWPYGQHSAIVLPNRNILMYDNGTARGFYKETPREENLYTRAVEYAIDEANMTIQTVWEFDYMRAIFTLATGEIDYQPDTGHRLISFVWRTTEGLSTPRVVELNPANEIVFEYLVNEGTGGYRSDKFDLYENID